MALGVGKGGDMEAPARGATGHVEEATLLGSEQEGFTEVLPLPDHLLHEAVKV